MEYLRVDKGLIPYSTNIVLDGTLYKIMFYYNLEHDFFTLDLYVGSELIVAGEKITLGAPLFATVMHRNVPQNILLVPLDLSEVETEVNYENFMETVFIYIFSRDDIDAAV